MSPLGSRIPCDTEAPARASLKTKAVYGPESSAELGEFIGTVTVPKNAVLNKTEVNDRLGEYLPGTEPEERIFESS
jgi:hypothetical protein